MSKYSRQKGHSWERFCAAEFRELGFKDCITKREARGGDWQYPDDGRDLVRTPGFAIQCKRLHSYVPVSTIEEIIDYPMEKETRIVITKADNKDAMAILPWKNLKQLIKDAHIPKYSGHPNDTKALPIRKRPPSER